MNIEVTQTGGACGAVVRGIDLTEILDSEEVSNLHSHWLKHHVLVFPEQDISDDDLLRFSSHFGVLSLDPYIESIDGYDHIVAMTRLADESGPIFAEAWHSDWSFKPTPPIGSCLRSIVIPPRGGHTSFIDQQKALLTMPKHLRSRIEGKSALHSARGAYAPEGVYGDRDKASNRSIKVRTSKDARTVQEHPLIMSHPESGEEMLFGCFGYIVGIKGMTTEQGCDLLREILEWQTRGEFRYDHEWEEKMVVLWDNRSVLHKANGGYEGYDRILHRTTIEHKTASNTCL